MPNALRYDVLTRHHEEYTPQRWEELWTLYRGGYAVMDAASDFLPRVVGENPVSYKQRVRGAAYIGYFGPIVNTMVAQLFGQELAIAPAADSKDPTTAGEDPTNATEMDDFYREFAKATDGKDCTFPDLCRKLVRTALVQRRSYMGYDSAPVTPETAPTNLAEEERSGALQLRAFEIDPLTLIDWEYDDEDELTLAVIRRVFNRRTALSGDRSKSYEEFKCWIREGTVVRWELYRTRLYSKEEPLKPEEEIPLVESGSVSFPCIPILTFELPEELWIGNAVAPLNKEHFQRRSELIAAEQRSLFEIPVYKLGSEIGSDDGPLPSEVQQNPHRAQDPRQQLVARGFAVIGADDDIEFKGPTGAAYTIADQQLKELVDEIYRVVAMMAQSISSTSTALHRSGDSKSADADALAVVLREFGNLVRKFAVRIYRAIGTARGDTEIIWQAHGLENYNSEVRADLINEAVQVDLVAIPSATFKRHYKTSIAFKLVPEMDPATKEVVRQEINDGVAAEDSLRLSQLDTEQQIADNGPTPEQLGIPDPPPPGA